jgi:DNA-binding NtrC family response regulator
MEKILVVDDQESILMVVQTVLARQNYTVITARNGRDALEKLALMPDMDLIITDIIMPDIDGLQLISTVHKLYPEIKIIAMSGGGSRVGAEIYLKEACQLGVAHVLTKPFVLNELVDVVEKTLSGMRGSMEM